MLGASTAGAMQDVREGRLAEAERACHDVIAVDPRNPAALHLLGFISHARGNDEHAMELISLAVTAAPTEAVYHADLGGLLLRAGRSGEAALSLSEALRLNPELAQASERLSFLLAHQGRLEEATRVARDAMRNAPHDIELLSRVGSTLMVCGAVHAAQECFEHVLNVDPGSANAHVGLGMCLLTQGDFERGWAEFEWRFTSSQMDPSGQRSMPRWTGERLNDQRLLVWAEQGLGDTLQFVRYIPHLADRAATVILEVQPELVRLLSDSLPDIDVISSDGNVPAYDVQVPLMSLPNVLSTRLESIPHAVPYLRVPSARSASWSERLGPRSTGKRVGLAWAGNSRHVNDAHRSIDPHLLAALGGAGDVEWVSLQKTASTTPLPLRDFSSEMSDLAETAALMMNLDIVLTVDTSIAHLAGALGKPVWILLPYGAEWRWMRDRSDSAWYPSATLFRQPRPGDWQSVLANVAARVGNL